MALQIREQIGMAFPDKKRDCNCGIRKMKFSILVVTLLLIMKPAIAYDMERAVVNLASDLSQCAAFLYIVSKSSEEQAPEVSNAYASLSLNMHEMAIEISNEKVAIARLNMNIKEMLEEIDGSFSNISILLNEYLTLCQEMSNDIEQRLQYWLDQDD